MKTTRDILDERQSTHGSFPTCAEASQEIKRLIKYYGKDLHVTQKEALEMIAVKIARILNGGHNHQDSWQDIAGYAMLGGGIYTPQSPELINFKGYPCYIYKSQRKTELQEYIIEERDTGRIWNQVNEEELKEYTMLKNG